MEKTKHTNKEMTRPKPIPPLPEDCCGQGCVPCVNDIYETELRLWKNECKQLELESELTETSNKLIYRDSYTSFKIKEIIPLTNDTFIYQFELPYATARLLPNNLAIGQHLILRLVLENHSDVDEDQIQVTGGSITRQYTILSSPTAQGYFDIMIKLPVVTDGCHDDLHLLPGLPPWNLFQTCNCVTQSFQQQPSCLFLLG